MFPFRYGRRNSCGDIHQVCFTDGCTKLFVQFAMPSGLLAGNCLVDAMHDRMCAVSVCVDIDQLTRK